MYPSNRWVWVLLGARWLSLSPPARVGPTYGPPGNGRHPSLLLRNYRVLSGGELSSGSTGIVPVG